MQIDVKIMLHYLLCFVALTSVTSITVEIPPIYYLVLGGLPLFLLISRDFKRKSLLLLIFIIAPSTLSLFSLGYLFISPDLRFIDAIYSDGFFWVGRFLNIFLMSLFFILATHLYDAGKQGKQYYQQFLKCYMWSGLFLLGTAIWQIVAHYTGVISFPFETRSHVHSSHGVNIGTSLRVTGMAAEPSYLAPYMTDLIAVTLMIYGWRTKSIAIVLLALLVIGFSLSPTGYFIFIGAVALAGVSVFFKYKSKFSIYVWLLILTSIPIIGGVGLYIINNSVFDYILTRLITFTPESSSRAYMNFMVPYWLAEGEGTRAFIGYGMKSYALIGEYYNLPNGTPVHVTSNNLFIDILWEAGALGLFLVISLFVYVYVGIYRLKIGRGESLILFYYFFDLLLSSLMRADFSSPRFFIFFIVFWILKNSRRYYR